MEETKDTKYLVTICNSSGEFNIQITNSLDEAKKYIKSICKDVYDIDEKLNSDEMEFSIGFYDDGIAYSNNYGFTHHIKISIMNCTIKENKVDIQIE